MKTYSFMLKDSFRIDVKSSSPKSGYNKLMKIEKLKNRITKSYIKYNKDGLANIHDWKTLE